VSLGKEGFDCARLHRARRASGKSDSGENLSKHAKHRVRSGKRGERRKGRRPCFAAQTALEETFVGFSVDRTWAETERGTQGMSLPAHCSRLGMEKRSREESCFYSDYLWKRSKRALSWIPSNGLAPGEDGSLKSTQLERRSTRTRFSVLGEECVRGSGGRLDFGV